LQAISLSVGVDEYFFGVEAITETTNAARYWSDLKRQMVEKEGFSEVYDEIVKLNMPGRDCRLVT